MKTAHFECTVDGVTIGYEYEPAQNGGFDEPSYAASIDVVCVDVDLLSVDLMTVVTDPIKRSAIAKQAKEIAEKHFASQSRVGKSESWELMRDE